MDYEEAAKKLIVYSNGVAKGLLGTTVGLSAGEAPVLEYLSRDEKGQNPSELAERLGYTRPRMTRILDSLEQKGFIERVHDEQDRRRVIVWATEKGREHASSKQSEGVDALARTLSSLGERESKQLLKALEQAYSITYDRDDILGGGTRS
jgi:DNA-binding MarR family transcriptional regulator